MKRRLSILVLAVLVVLPWPTIAEEAPKPKTPYTDMWIKLSKVADARKATLLSENAGIEENIVAHTKVVKELEKKLADTPELDTSPSFKANIARARADLEKTKAANLKFTQDLEALDKDIQKYKDMVEQKPTPGYGAATPSMEEQLKALDLRANFNDWKLDGATHEVKLEGIERAMDQMVAGAYVREKIASALTATLCDDELKNKCSGDRKQLRQAIDDKMSGLYYDPHGGEGRTREGSAPAKNHKK